MQGEQRGAQAPHGRQSVKKLMGQDVATNSLPLNGDTKLFDRVAREFNVDYAFHKTEPGKYLLFFKAGQADAITACFEKYTKLVMERSQNRKTPIREQLRQFAQRIKEQPQERQRTREAGRDER